MGKLKDIIIASHSVLVMFAVQYLLQEHKLVDCQDKYCSSGINNQAADEKPYRAGFLSWTTDEETPQDLSKCLCCKTTNHGFLYFVFTTLGLVHVAISVATISLKYKAWGLSNNCVWIYLLLISATVINTLLITRLFVNITHENSEEENSEGMIWKILTMPFQLIWRTITSFVIMLFYKLIISPLGVVSLFRQQQNSTRDTSLYLCSLTTDSMTSLNAMIENGLAVLSWTYVLSAAANLYSLMNCLSKEQCVQNNNGRYASDGQNGNNVSDEQYGEDACHGQHVNDTTDGKYSKDVCRLCKEIQACKRRELLDTESDDSDNESFVLGWRL